MEGSNVKLEDEVKELQKEKETLVKSLTCNSQPLISSANLFSSTTTPPALTIECQSNSTPPIVDIQEVGGLQSMVSVNISPEEIQPSPMNPNLGNLYCALCERSFQLKNGLAMHMKTSIDHKIKAISQGKSVRCNSCEQEVTSRVQLLDHFETHYKRNNKKLRKCKMKLLGDWDKDVKD